MKGDAPHKAAIVALLVCAGLASASPTWASRPYVQKHPLAEGLTSTQQIALEAIALQPAVYAIGLACIGVWLLGRNAPHVLGALWYYNTPFGGDTNACIDLPCATHKNLLLSISMSSARFRRDG